MCVHIMRTPQINFRIDVEPSETRDLRFSVWCTPGWNRMVVSFLQYGSETAPWLNSEPGK